MRGGTTQGFPSAYFPDFMMISFDQWNYWDALNVDLKILGAE